MKFEWQRVRARAKIQAPNTQTPGKFQISSSKVLALTAAVAVVGVSGLKVWAQDAATNTAPAVGASADDITALRQKIEELERKVKELEEKNKSEAQTDKDKARTDDLEQKVKVLERNRELDVEAAEAKAKEAPKIAIGSDGFSFGNADGSYALQLKGVLQVDSRTFFHDAGIVGNDGFLLRRARPVLQGTVARDFDFLFVPDFGGSSVQIFDAYLN